ncbi:MAG TPA: tyrosine-protein phosphatase [Gemmataceae bacterium]|nr:tyrosine-protein phosphatase [Gemmataceae bacterium]
MMAPERRRRFRAAVLCLLGASLWANAGCRPTAPRNFGVVKPGVLYRSGQVSAAEFGRVLADHQIRTVVTLRPARGEVPNSDAHEEELCRARGVRYVRIPPPAGEHGESPLGRVAADFLRVTDDPANHPVWVHCTAGRDRTGAMCAVYRMEYDGWTPDRALAEMREYGFDPDKDAAARAYAEFVLTYRPRKAER